MKIKRIILALLMSMSCVGIATGAEIDYLRCEYNESPINVDTQTPRFTWICRDFNPAKFVIKVASDESDLIQDKNILWCKSVSGKEMRVKYEGKRYLRPHTRYFWQVTALSEDGMKIISPIQTFTTAKFMTDHWNAKWISDGMDKEMEAAPMFRKTFNVKKGVERASLYVTSTGYNEIRINGKRIDDTHMNPGYTHFDKRLLYDVVDITQFIKEGINVITGVLGNGFYNCQSKAVWDFENARWRDRPRLLCEILITDADGKTQCIAKTDSTWEVTTGPYTYNNIYSGDRYDGRLEINGWDNPEIMKLSERNAVEVAAPTSLLIAQMQPPIRPTEIIQPTLVKTWGDTIFVFDMGKNISGVSELTVTGETGTHFRLSHGEMLKNDLRLQQGNIDIYYRPEKPGERFQTDEFILSGKGMPETFKPMFTYHGFRFVEVTSDRPVNLSAENLKGYLIHTDVSRVGHFECSDELLNKIYQATMLSYVDNLHSIPTDCPQREKNGWTADAHAAIDLALLNYDGITFYEKWMNDFIDNQKEDGNISGIIPTSSWGYGDSPGPVWDAALFIIPEALYNYYGDMETIVRLYPTMKRYFSWAKQHENEDGLMVNGIGDWLPYKSQTPTQFTSAVYYYLDNVRMARFAEIMGDNARYYKEEAKRIKDKINDVYFDKKTCLYAGGTQAAQGVALYAGIVPEKYVEKVAGNMNDMIVRNNYRLDFGLLGSKTVLRMLSVYGYSDTAFRMATGTDAPSWGYWIDRLGYTTLPETWVMDPEFHDASLNHVFFGDISAWMTNHLAGIRYDADYPGFEKFTIAPDFISGLDYVNASYNSVKGRIASYWYREGDDIIMEVEIPYGTEATVRTDISQTVEGGHHRFRFSTHQVK